MEVIGIICEYNPFHNGHLYHINKIKEIFPDSIIILALNGYFLERGEISILSKEEKTKIALQNNIDLVVEIPFVFGSQSADTFAYASTFILNEIGCNKIVFGSECNDINKLTKIAKKQLEDNFNETLKEELKKGINYPTALNKSIGISLNSPNDLLGVSYIKAILKNKFNLDPITIKRTNDYLDTLSNDGIVSSSNIREKLKNNIDVSKYINYKPNFNNVDNTLLFNIIKSKILTSNNLNDYLTVDEGIEYKLKKEIINANNLDEYISKIKSKRYTYNRIKRMLIHILLEFNKIDRDNLKIEYIKVLGFNDIGQKYLKTIKSNLLISRKISSDYLAQKYELKASLIYDLLTNDNSYHFEISNKPIKQKNID